MDFLLGTVENVIFFVIFLVIQGHIFLAILHLRQLPNVPNFLSFCNLDYSGLLFVLVYVHLCSTWWLILGFFLGTVGYFGFSGLFFFIPDDIFDPGNACLGILSFLRKSQWRRREPVVVALPQQGSGSRQRRHYSSALQQCSNAPIEDVT